MLTRITRQVSRMFDLKILFSKIINRRVWRQGQDDLAVFYCLCGTFSFLGSAINSEIAVQEFF